MIFLSLPTWTIYFITLESSLHFPASHTAGAVTRWLFVFPEFITSLLAAIYAAAVLIVMYLPGVRRYNPSKSL